MSICEDCDQPSLRAEFAPLLIPLIIMCGGLWFVTGRTAPDMSTWATLNLVAGLGGYFCLIFLAWDSHVEKNEVAGLVFWILVVLEIIWWVPQGIGWLWTHTHITFG